MMGPLKWLLMDHLPFHIVLPKALVVRVDGGQGTAPRPKSVTLEGQPQPQLLALVRIVQIE